MQQTERWWRHQTRSRARADPGTRFDNLPVDQLRRRLTGLAARYQFDVVSLELWQPLPHQLAPKIVVKTEHYAALAQATPIILKQLDPKRRTRDDRTGWRYEGFFKPTISTRSRSWPSSTSGAEPARAAAANGRAASSSIPSTTDEADDRASGTARRSWFVFADVLAEFERDGYIIVEETLDTAALRRLRSAVDRIWLQEARDGAALHRLAFVGLDDAFIELVDHPATLPIVCAALGGNIYLYHCHLDVHPPTATPSAQWRWHQDGGRQNLELESPRPRLSVKVAYFLTDVPSEDHGALRVLPGSHHSDTLPREREPANATPLLVRAGSAVVFDRRLWHARGDNRSSQTRRALFYAYTYRWICPRDELALDPARLERLSPIRRQLLDGGSSVLGHWIPTDADTPLARTAAGPGFNLASLARVDVRRQQWRSGKRSG